jgi:DNA-binding MarR family transcriptional regulator
MSTTATSSTLSCPSIVNDERMVLMGLLTEVDARLQRILGAELEHACGISLAWLEVLVRIRRSPEGRLTMSAVADQTVYTSGGTTRLIDRIEQAGLVRRAHCPSDRRTIYVELTDEGIAALDGATSHHLEHLEQHLTGVLSPAERATLIELLTKLNGKASSQR